MNPLFHIIIPVASYWHWLVTLQVKENTWRVFKSAQLQRGTSSCWVSTASWALQGMEVPGTHSTHRKSSSTQAFCPPYVALVSLNAIGEERWSFLQGYTEVSEVSAAVRWGKMLPLTGHTTDTDRVFLVCLSLHVIVERGALASCWFPALGQLYCYRDKLHLAAHPSWAI